MTEPTLTVDYPDRPLNRLTSGLRVFTVIPIAIMLASITGWSATLGALLVVIYAWFAILFTGRYPRGAFDYVQGVLRWQLRVVAHAFVLVTDAYPPFSLQPVR